MRRSSALPAALGLCLAAAACERKAESPAAPAPTTNAGEPATVLDLPDSETAVPMQRPILPARAPGSCPSVDRCEFGTNWQACEAIAVYRDPSSDAPILRMLKPMEKFVAEGGEIELHAPGQVEVTAPTPAAETGGMSFPVGTMFEVYGPLENSRALYYDPASGKGFSPAAADDHFYWSGATAKMLSSPIMTWWVKVALTDGQRGWLRLRWNEDIANFPHFSTNVALLDWNVDMIRDDESPDCAGVLAEKARNDPTRRAAEAS